MDIKQKFLNVYWGILLLNILISAWFLYKYIIQSTISLVTFVCKTTDKIQKTLKNSKNAIRLLDKNTQVIDSLLKKAETEENENSNLKPYLEVLDTLFAAGASDAELKKSHRSER